MKPNLPGARGFGTAWGTRFEAYFGAEHIYHGCWGSDSVRWPLLSRGAPSDSGPPVPPVLRLPQEAWRDFPEGPFGWVGGFLSEKRTSQGHRLGVSRKLLAES